MPKSADKIDISIYETFENDEVTHHSSSIFVFILLRTFETLLTFKDNEVFKHSLEISIFSFDVF